MATYTINPTIDIETIGNILAKKQKIALSADSKARIVACRDFLDEKLRSNKELLYGINTGFGSLCDTPISEKNLTKLQKNLVMSHACGVGEEVSPEIVRLMLLMKIQGLCYGNSGVQLQTVERLVLLYNHDILPVVYQQGSLGASGDLVPLAHLALPLIGEGEVFFKNKKRHAKDVLRIFKWKPIRLRSKEGLALLNGTQFMTAYGVHCLLRSQRLAVLADTIAALSLDAFDGRIEPFDKRLHAIRPHKGQVRVARHVSNLLKGSRLMRRKKDHVQDPYSFRCIPQVHGASRDVIRFAADIVRTKMNSITDNPIIFPEENAILSGGNFHGQPLAFALDFLAMALGELGSISERRTYQMISGARQLPPFLVANPGLNSGFMIPQYTAASIVSQNKQLCTPASVDSIVSSNGQEDHVSMGGNAATKCVRVVDNLEKILAIELFTAAQAIEFRRPATTSPILEKIIAEYRKKVKFIPEDAVMYNRIERSIRFLRNYRSSDTFSS
ncbi:MAG: histidine ammonia-lyase [Candidatus Kaiserbacteria bacterium GW2011_GWB1_52_6]|uniref:Histidine ammonia-lyase n=1 Tax=Candidatus Kaiserbacteria bacterium GW2011_GWB1_52_6 TaxID=1618674 RepID=A0A0G1ZI68_9BACT|nr:MAG: histidine ammonia-lyase [Candidatus Kaiserbacteria bacterium GW2011_GWB1_52_6]